MLYLKTFCDIHMLTISGKHIQIYNYLLYVFFTFNQVFKPKRDSKLFTNSLFFKLIYEAQEQNKIVRMQTNRTSTWNS